MQVENQLQATLERRGTDALDELTVWLKTAGDRLKWCRDVNGDRYSVDAKLAVVKDLLGQLPNGEEKLHTAQKKIDSIKSALNEQRCHEMEQTCRQKYDEWQDFVSDLHNTR